LKICTGKRSLSWKEKKVCVLFAVTNFYSKFISLLEFTSYNIEQELVRQLQMLRLEVWGRKWLQTILRYHPGTCLESKTMEKPQCLNVDSCPRCKFCEFKSRVLISTLQYSVQNRRLELNKHIQTVVLKCQSLIYTTQVLNNY
jgi:hypothetical protein